jgi:hypothetical protein
LKGGILSADDPNLESKAFQAYLSTKAHNYGDKFKVYEEGKPFLDQAEAFKIKQGQQLLEFKEKQKQNAISNDFKQQNVDLQAKKLSLDAQKALKDISPAAAKQLQDEGILSSSMDLGASGPMKNSYAKDLVKMNAEQNGEGMYNTTLNNFKNENIEIASNIVFSLLKQGGEIGTRVQQLIDKGHIKTLQANGKTVKDKYLVSDAGLKTMAAVMDTFNNTQGQVYAGDNANVKVGLDKIAQNNFRYHFLENQKAQIYAKHGVKPGDMNYKPATFAGVPAGGGMMVTSWGSGTAPTGNIAGANKELLTVMQHETESYLVPVTQFNENRSKEGAHASTRQNVLNQAFQFGAYSPLNPSKVFSLTKSANGKLAKSDSVFDKLYTKDKDGDIVDLDNSFENINPYTNEVILRLKDKSGKPIVMDEFPNGEARIKVNDATINAMLTEAGTGLNKNNFAKKEFTYDIAKYSTDKYANEFFKGKTLPIPGVDPKYNVGINIEKTGETFFITIPAIGKVKQVTSVDDFNKNFAYMFETALQQTRTDPAYANLKTEQERVNVALQALKLRL